MTQRRLQKELKELNDDPPFTCTAGLIDKDDFYNWQVTIQAPDDSPYCGGLFLLNIHFPSNYPIEHPQVYFETPIFHPNIEPEGGYICLDILDNHWTPALTISKVLSSLVSLLNNPNPKSPLNGEAADLYENNRRKYDDTVRQWTKKYSL